MATSLISIFLEEGIKTHSLSNLELLTTRGSPLDLEGELSKDKNSAKLKSLGHDCVVIRYFRLSDEYNFGDSDRDIHRELGFKPESAIWIYPISDRELSDLSYLAFRICKYLDSNEVPNYSTLSRTDEIQIDIPLLGFNPRRNIERKYFWDVLLQNRGDRRIVSIVHSIARNCDPRNYDMMKEDPQTFFDILRQIYEPTSINLQKPRS